MLGLGVPELLVVMIIVMIVFGAGKLPQIGSGIGKGIKNFKTAVRELPEESTAPEGRKEAP